MGWDRRPDRRVSSHTIGCLVIIYLSGNFSVVIFHDRYITWSSRFIIPFPVYKGDTILLFLGRRTLKGESSVFYTTSEVFPPSW